MGGGKRRPNRISGGGRFYAGDVPAKTKAESSGPRRTCNAVPYSYSHPPSDDPSRPIQFVSSSVVAFVDPTPSADVDTPILAYNYDPAITGGLGLGFRTEEAESEEEEEEEEEDEEEENERRGEGFISIGGVRVYTEDTSSPEDDVSGSGSGSDSSDDDADEGQSSDGSCSDDDDDEGSDIDEEVVDDYLEGIGGSGELMNSKWMAKRNLEEEFMDFEESSSDEEDGGKLGAIEVMNVSREYGMSKTVKKKIDKVKVNSRRAKVEFRLSAAMDDLMFEKDDRMVSGRKSKKKMKEISQLSRSWPREGQRSRNYYAVPGIY